MVRWFDRLLKYAGNKFRLRQIGGYRGGYGGYGKSYKIVCCTFQLFLTLWDSDIFFKSNLKNSLKFG